MASPSCCIRSYERYTSGGVWFFFFLKMPIPALMVKKRKNYNQCLHKANGENFQLK